MAHHQPLPWTNGPAEPVAALDDALRAATLRIRTLRMRVDCGCGSVIPQAARNLVAGRPAFWTNGGYSFASAGILNFYVNEFASLFGGVEELQRVHPDRRWMETPLLDTLLPLNPQAVRELRMGYDACGTFRSDDDLVRRTAKAEGTYRAVLSDAAELVGA